ncbi:D-aminoacyl-tRNA deacylase [Portibacter lacus]|uniref:D-aminoacyl-tRNA deacylase n=1 Tax=Portibacter lacus TaxID=1099794 RepID=A0AA37SNQ7_9BACT|nr:D-aminoacyl-tRNA deacylase [Portibacter lacus]GLR18046.1 D-aminoacyl-tRNA deacylase [Portibacter lacus]
MRAIIQRVKYASVEITGEIHNKIEHGILLLLGIEDADENEDTSWIIRKVSNMRIFNDEEGVMNKSLLDINGEILIISQFTLFASTKKGNRPSYIAAAKPEIAIPKYEHFLAEWEKETKIQAKAGVFGADMKVELLNDGPVTIFMDSKNKV